MHGCSGRGQAPVLLYFGVDRLLGRDQLARAHFLSKFGLSTSASVCQTSPFKGAVVHENTRENIASASEVEKYL